MAIRVTKQGCTVETICAIQPNGTYTEHVTLSVDPANALSLEEAPVEFQLPALKRSRVRATRFGFELVERR